MVVNANGYDNVHGYKIHELDMRDNESLVEILLNNDGHGEQEIHVYDKLQDYVNDLFLQCDDQLPGLCNVRYDEVDGELLWLCDEQDLPCEQYRDVRLQQQVQIQYDGGHDVGHDGGHDGDHRLLSKVQIQYGCHHHFGAKMIHLQQQWSKREYKQRAGNKFFVKKGESIIFSYLPSFSRIRVLQFIRPKQSKEVHCLKDKFKLIIIDTANQLFISALKLFTIQIHINQLTTH